MKTVKNKMDKKTPDDLSSVIAHITGSDIYHDRPGMSKGVTTQSVGDNIFAGRLWKEFSECLSDSESDTDDEERSSKKYAIDNDIVETIRQCNFGKPNIRVINSILRVFLTDNIPNLLNLPNKKVNTILDQYKLSAE